jgi:amidase
MFAADNQTYNDVFGTTNNPWDVTRTSGGSSGGAAAAVATGLTSMELGSDIAGSIRNPAHYCGVYGHKPSAGIVSGRGHIPGPPGMLAPVDIGVIGPLARSADDLDLAMSVIASPAPADATAWRLELPPPRHNALRDYRVAAWLDDSTAPVDGAVLDRLHEAVNALRDAGVAVDEDARPPFTLEEMYMVAFHLISGVTCSGFDDVSFDAFARAVTQFPPDDNGPVAMFLRASTQSKRAWNAINERRWRMRAGWAEFFRSYDVLLCPAAQTAAFVHDHGANHAARTVPVNGEPRSNAEALAWAGFVGAAGLPASVAPVGFTGEGLPVGVQIVGPYLEDRTTIDFARRLAGVIGGYTPPPGFE